MLHSHPEYLLGQPSSMLKPLIDAFLVLLYSSPLFCEKLPQAEARLLCRLSLRNKFKDVQGMSCQWILS